MSHNNSAAHASRNRLVIVLVVTLAVLMVEVIGGLASNSLALLAAAGRPFPANHLREHMATSSPMSVGFEVVGDQRLATRLTDAE